MGNGSTSGGEPDVWGELDGVTITFPVVVDSFRSATLTFTVPLDAARALVPGPAFEAAETGAGTATLVVALCDYVENPWGDYLEVNLGLLAHPVGDPTRVGAFQWRMPVDQEFTCLAGNRVLGLPKTVEDLTLREESGEVAFELRLDGRSELVVAVPAVPPAGDPVPVTTSTWSYLDGEPTEVPLTIDLATGLVDPGSVRIELGDGPIAAELRSLGLPCAPDLATWGEGLRGTFARPRPVA
jgi:hypothetical protein